MLKAQTRLQTHWLSFFIPSVVVVVFAEMQMNVFIYGIIYGIFYAELIVLLSWKHTVCTHTHTHTHTLSWLCDSYSVWQDSEPQRATPRLNIQQALKTGVPVPQIHFPAGACGWIQLRSLPSAASRKGSLMFRFVEATEVICLHPGVHESSVELALRRVSRPLLRYQEIITPSGPSQVVQCCCRSTSFHIRVFADIRKRFERTAVDFVFK